MPPEVPNPLNIVVMRNESPETLDRIASLAPSRVRVTRVSDRGDQPGDDAVLREGHVVMVSQRCPRDLRAKMPHLLWVHAGFAGVTDLIDRDFWGTDVTVTSARGRTGALPIAEMALIAGLMIAKDLHLAAKTVMTHRRTGHDVYKPWLVSNKTIGIIGLGGIGGELARLAKGVGLRVLGLRRSATHRQRDVDGLDELFPPSDLLAMAAESHFLAICAASTPETFQMVDGPVLDALPEGAVVMNVARGEIIDEGALIKRLESGRLGGAYLDVYAGERERDPYSRLAAHPNVVMTPHMSDASDTKQHFSTDIFCDNLLRFLDGRPLVNVVDWERGY